MKTSGAQIVWESLVREGVDTIFGYPGGFNLPLYDALPRFPIRHILARHEQGAAHMADGYARASGKTGVALATSGPGATNLVTGIATAMMDSSPVVFLTGQVNNASIGFDAFQEADIFGITLPITKQNYLVNRAEDLAPTLQEAFYLARSGRPGPVLVDITKDAQIKSIDWAYDKYSFERPGYRAVDELPANNYAFAGEVIGQAKKPLILAGRGVLLSGAEDELLSFVEKTQIPVITTLLGIGAFPASHPYCLGMSGMHGNSWANLAIQDADLLIAFGMRFDDRVTGNLKTFAPHARIIHADIDRSQIDKNVKADVALLGDLKMTLPKLTQVTPSGSHEEWLDQIQENREESQSRDILNQADEGRLMAPHAIFDLWQATKGNAIVTTDVGQHQMWAAQYFKQDQSKSFITSGGMGTMGFGLPSAIGAKIACPEKEVWTIVGDGGFQMTQAELSTAAQENIKVNIAVINNGYLGLVRQWQELFFDHRYTSTPMLSPDFVKIAEAHGLNGMRVSSRADVPAAIQKAQQTPGTFLLEFQVEPEVNVYPMVPAGGDLHNMLRRPVSNTQSRKQLFSMYMIDESNLWRKI